MPSHPQAAARRAAHAGPQNDNVSALEAAPAPMPRENVDGPGRDPRFDLPQFFVPLRGVRTAFFDAGAGPVFVFLHGLVGNGTHWVNVAPRFVDRARVIGMDLPGCGESDKPGVDYSVIDYADHVRALLDRLDISRAILVGHSLGGMVAAECAFRHRNRVAGLVLLDPAGFQRMNLAVRLGSRLVLRERLLNAVLPRTWRRILRQVFHHENQYTRAFIETVERTYDPVRDIRDMSRVMAALRADLVDRDFTRVLDRLDLPTWMLWGAEDRLVPAKHLRRAAELLPNVTADEIPGCGHMPNIECPGAVNALLDRVLDTIAARRA